jgi:hypothetical protein
MKRVLTAIGHLKKLSGQVKAAGEGVVNLNGQDTVFLNPAWLDELATNLDAVAEGLTGVIADKLNPPHEEFPPSEPHSVKEPGNAWVCLRCNRIWDEEVQACTICGMTQEKAKGEAEDEG